MTPGTFWTRAAKTLVYSPTRAAVVKTFLEEEDGFECKGGVGSVGRVRSGPPSQVKNCISTRYGTAICVLLFEFSSLDLAPITLRVFRYYCTSH